MSYFVGILCGVRDIFLSGRPQVFFPLNVRFRGISKPQKNIQSKESNPLINSIDNFESRDLLLN